MRRGKDIFGKGNSGDNLETLLLEEYTSLKLRYRNSDDDWGSVKGAYRMRPGSIDEHLREQETKYFDPDFRKASNLSQIKFFDPDDRKKSGLYESLSDFNEPNLEKKILKNYEEISDYKILYNNNKNNLINEYIISEKYSLNQIIYSLLDSGYGLKKGKRERKEDFFNESIPFRPETQHPFSTIPARFSALAAHLAREHPGLEYRSCWTLQNRSSRHVVEVVSFTYIADGEIHELPVVAKHFGFSAEEKAFLDKQRAIPKWLREECGFDAHDVYGCFGFNQVAMEYVDGASYLGDKDVDFSMIRGRSRDIGKRLAELHTKAASKTDVLEKKYGLFLEKRSYAKDFDNKVFKKYTRADDADEIGYQISVSNLIGAVVPLIAKLEQNQIYPIHGDPRVENLRINGKVDPIDWETGRLGRVFWDLARCVCSITTNPEYQGGFDEDEFKEAYRGEFLARIDDPEIKAKNIFEDLYIHSKIYESMVRMSYYAGEGRIEQAGNCFKEFLEMTKDKGMIGLRDAFVDYASKTTQLRQFVKDGHLDKYPGLQSSNRLSQSDGVRV